MFTIHCENIVRAATGKASPDEGRAEPPGLATRIASVLRGSSSQLASLESPRGTRLSDAGSPEGQKRLCPDMIRRVDDAPKLVNPSGSIIESQVGPTDVRSMTGSDKWTQSPSEGLHSSQPPLGQERNHSPIQPVTSGEFRIGQSRS